MCPYTAATNPPQPPHSHFPFCGPTKSPGLPFNSENRFQDSAVAEVTSPPNQALLGKKMGPGAQQRDRHIVGTQAIFVANKQTKVTQINLIHGDCGGKQERNLLREAEGGDMSVGGLGGRGQKGKQPAKAGPGTESCSYLGPAATEAGRMSRSVWFGSPLL